MKTLLTIVALFVGLGLIAFGGSAILLSHFGEVNKTLGWYVTVYGSILAGPFLIAVPHLRQFLDSVAVFVNNHASNKPSPLPPATPLNADSSPVSPLPVRPLQFGMPTISGSTTQTQPQKALQDFVLWETTTLTHLAQAYEGNPELRKATVKLLTDAINSHFLPDEGTNHAYAA